MIELQLKLSSSWINRSFKTTIENKSFSGGKKTLQHEMRLMEEKTLVPGGGEDHLENHIKTFR